MRSQAAQEKVVVRIWNTSVKRGRAGHASLETFDKTGRSVYMSFWPAIDNPDFMPEDTSYVVKKSTDGKSYLRTRKYDFHIGEQGQAPSHTIELYSLDAERINQAFERFKKSNFKWHLLASSGIYQYFFSGKGAQNCSGLCFNLLLEGGAQFPTYPMTDFYGHLFVFCKVTQVSLSETEGTRLTRALFGVVDGMSTNFSARGFGAFSELYLNNFRHNPFTLGNLIAWFLFGMLITREGKDRDFILPVSDALSIAFPALLIFFHYHLIGKTITPSDMINMVRYNQALENKTYSSFLLHHDYYQGESIPRKQVNTGLALLNAFSTAYLLYDKTNILYRLNKMAFFFRILMFSFSSGLNTYLGSMDPRIPLSAFLSGLPFLWAGFYPGSHGLLGSLSSVPDLLGSPLAGISWVVFSKIIFYGADWLIQKIEKYSTQARDIQESFFSTLIKPRSLIKFGAYATSSGLGFWAAKSMGEIIDQGKFPVIEYAL